MAEGRRARRGPLSAARGRAGGSAVRFPPRPCGAGAARAPRGVPPARPRGGCARPLPAAAQPGLGEGGGRAAVGGRVAVVPSLPVALLQGRRAEREQARAARGASVPLLCPNRPTPGRIWF